MWNSTDKYKKTIWQCRHKYEGESKCTTPHLFEEDIKARFIVAFNKLSGNKENVIDDCRRMQELLTDYTELDTEISALTQETEVLIELTEKLVQENAHSEMDQEDYNKRYNGYVDRYNELRENLDDLEKKKHRRLRKASDIGSFMFELMEKEGVITEFDDGLFSAAVETITVWGDGGMTFKFKNGMEIEK